LRAILAEVVWAISHTKNNYLSAQYHRLARRLGKKKAVVQFLIAFWSSFTMSCSLKRLIRTWGLIISTNLMPHGLSGNMFVA
jgi:hypothetical protein